MIIIFAAATFLGSFLLFFLEPLVGKLLLPFFGGAPAIWNTCLVFFQVALLLGYLLSACLIRIKSLAIQIILVITLMGIPIGLDIFANFAMVDVGTAKDPLRSLLIWLTESVLLVFIGVSIIPTMVQHWFSKTNKSTISPYKLYAASNAGSLFGLVAYPFIFERSFGLKDQTEIWQISYIYLSALIGVTGLITLIKRNRQVDAPTAVPSFDSRNTDFPPRASASLITKWIILAGLPSALLLGSTNFILTDLVSLPLLWIAPLLVYLVTYIIAFMKPSGFWHQKLQIPASFLSILAICSFFMDVSTPLWPLVTVHLLVLLLLCQICHAKLAAAAPPTKLLGSFYVSLSLGGALGGVLIQFVAPLLFNRALEYPITIALILSTFSAIGSIKEAFFQKRSFFVALPLLLIIINQLLSPQFVPPQIGFIFGYGGAALILYSLSRQPAAYALGFSIFVLTATWIPSPLGKLVESRRNFYGITRTVVADNGNSHAIVHGSTIHGVQMLNTRDKCIPTSYYHRTSPVGVYFETLNRAAMSPPPPQSNTRNIGVVGLGVGSLICYAQESDYWKFFEINSDMQDIALDPRLFTFLKNSPTSNYEIEIGDGRLNILNSKMLFDLIILDAFSSDAIPVHLLTLEGIKTYQDKLSESGALLFHLSSRYFDLAPIVSAAGKQLNMVTYISNDPPVTPEEALQGKRQSLWLGLIPAKNRPDIFLNAGFIKADSQSTHFWTDDYSDPLRALF